MPRWQADTLKAPLLVSWQLTRDCNLACVHCCTESAPGKGLKDELLAHEAERLAAELIRQEVPYVTLCGGEPLIVPHFFAVAETLGEAGVQIKIESNGQLLDDTAAQRLARLPIRSVQISLDGDTPETYSRQRPGGSLAKAHAACRAVRAAGLPLEVTFAPTRCNIDEAAAVIDRALEFGAFRFNTGRLMRVGTAARLWPKVRPTADQEAEFRRLLAAKAAELPAKKMEFCYSPYSLSDGLRRSIAEPPAVLLVLPNGWVKVSAALPHICADLRRDSLDRAWALYRAAWRNRAFVEAASRAAANEQLHAEANRWHFMEEYQPVNGGEMG